MTNLPALKAAIKLVADAANDSIKAASDGNVVSKLSEYGNLISDLMALLPQIGDIPAEVNAMAPADYAELVAALATDIAIPNQHVAGVVNASVKLIGDLAVVIAPDVQALIAAIKAAPAPLSPPAPVAG